MPALWPGLALQTQGTWAPGAWHPSPWVLVGWLRCRMCSHAYLAVSMALLLAPHVDYFWKVFVFVLPQEACPASQKWEFSVGAFLPAQCELGPSVVYRGRACGCAVKESWEFLRTISIKSWSDFGQLCAPSQLHSSFYVFVVWVSFTL